MKKWRISSMVAMLTLLLSGCGKPYLSALKPAGEVAEKQFNLMILSTSIMVLVIIAVVIIFTVALLKFRRKKGDNSIPKQIEGNHTLEIIWTVIPIILLLVLAVPTIYYTFELANVDKMEDKDENGVTKDALVINVKANQYWWEFEYPDLGIVTGQELVVPTDEKVYFQLKASDVKHSFWIPAVGGKLDTNTDSINKFWLVFDEKKAKSQEINRVFYGKCAELCGPSHALMDFKVKALPRDEFDSWTTALKASKQTEPTDTVAKEGMEIFNKSCIGCHAVSGADERPEEARLAPNLADFGNRMKVAGVLDNNEGNVKKWIKNTSAVKEGNKMPSFGNELTDTELDALTKYLMSLKVQ